MEWLNDPLTWELLSAGILFGAVTGFLLRRPVNTQGEAQKSETLREVCRLCRDAVFIIENGKISFANPAAEKLGETEIPSTLKETENSLTFYHPEEQRWLTLSDLIRRHPLKKVSEFTLFKKLELGREKRIQVSVEIRTPSPRTQKRKRQIYYLISIQDTSCEKQLFDLRYLNTLTSLPNQFKAYSDITAITAKNNTRNRFAVIMLELDNASKLRSMLGYAELDAIITHTANVLREMSENYEIKIYHLNDVTFMMLFQHPQSNDEIYTLVEQFQQMIQESYGVLQNRQKITFSAGISLYTDQPSLNLLIDSAFGALAVAQEQGMGHTVLASEKIDRRMDHEIELTTEIEKAIANKGFKLYFQPIYTSNAHRLVGAEVLLRWHHPEKGLLMPNSFIPAAEKSGLILQIGKYVLEESLKQLKHWNSYGFPPLLLSLNLSLRELESQEFMNHLVKMLYQYQTGESRLKFEITEHATMINPTVAKQKLDEIRQLGIGISLDDFGTGYSSFSHLAEFPIETLKIDRSFVSGMTRDESKQHIVSAITKLGHSLGMNIIAEGVENKEEAAILASYGADCLQGYYFSRPLPQLKFQYLLSRS